MSRLRDRQTYQSKHTLALESKLAQQSSHFPEVCFFKQKVIFNIHTVDVDPVLFSCWSDPLFQREIGFSVWVSAVIFLTADWRWKQGNTALDCPPVQRGLWGQRWGSKHAEALAALTDGQFQHLVQLLVRVICWEAQLVKTGNKTKRLLSLWWLLAAFRFQLLG